MLYQLFALAGGLAICAGIFWFIKTYCGPNTPMWWQLPVGLGGLGLIVYIFGYVWTPTVQKGILNGLGFIVVVLMILAPFVWIGAHIMDRREKMKKQNDKSMGVGSPGAQE